MNYQQSASKLMQKCKQNMSNIFLKSPLKMDKSTSSNQKKSKINLGDLSKISPKQQQQNNKIIQRLRKKAKKKQKQLFIRKTDLGQNQKIFTNEQMQKLKQIDQQQFFGKPHKQKIDQINQIDTQDLCQIRDCNNNRKFFTNQNTQQQINKYLQWVDLKSIKNVDVNKKSKILNFQKNQRSQIDNMQTKYILPALITTKSHKGFRRSNTLKGVNNLTLKNNQTIDKSFLNTGASNNNNSNDKIYTTREKLNNIIVRVGRNVQNQLNNPNKYIYMTQQRKQALLQCETLKKIKNEMGMKFYNKLQLKYGNSKQNNIISKQHLDQHNKQNYNSFQSSYLNSNISLLGYGANQQLTQAERILQKNNNRIKEQRKRVIQKLIC